MAILTVICHVVKNTAFLSGNQMTDDKFYTLQLASLLPNLQVTSNSTV